MKNLKVKKISLLILIVFFIQACGYNLIENMYDPNTYVKKFEEHMGEDVDTKIEITNLPSDLEGICYKHKDVVKIDKQVWNDYYMYGREALVFHELGHCHFWLAHTVDRFQNGCPKSVMHPKINVDCYMDNRAFYMNELKQRAEEHEGELFFR